MKLRIFFIFLVFALFFSQFFFAGDFLTGMYIRGQIHDEGTIEPYFCPHDDCEGVFVSYLENASRVYCAFYDLSLPRMIEALDTDRKNVIIFEENSKGLPNAFHSVRRHGLMHNKFCVLDKEIVITGSMNPTENGAYRNNNNLLVIHSEVLAKNYYNEYRELFGNTQRRTSYTRINLSGNIVENYFCPEDRCEDRILLTLSKAQEEILFMTFSFTSDPIGDMLIRKFVAGVDVRGVFEASQRNAYWEFEKLTNETILVKTDQNPNAMHHKVFIIDGKTVITGSMNPSNNGNKNNDENMLIIHDEKIAAAYIKEFDRVWSTKVIPLRPAKS